MADHGLKGTEHKMFNIAISAIFHICYQNINNTFRENRFKMSIQHFMNFLIRSDVYFL